MEYLVEDGWRIILHENGFGQSLCRLVLESKGSIYQIWDQRRAASSLTKAELMIKTDDSALDRLYYLQSMSGSYG